MTSAFSAVHGVRGLKAEALAKSRSKETQFHLRSGDLYLHESATKLQVGKANAWVGTIEQARNCRAQHSAAVGCIARRIITIPHHVQEPA